MMNKDDGGPAFPLEQPHPDGGTFYSQGMSLRDYFAARAMQAYLSDPAVESWPENASHIAHTCYQVADAMLKARKQ